MGAAAGALLGALVDGKRGAEAGAAVGALGGLAYGNEVAKKKKAALEREQELQAAAQQWQQVADNARVYNEQLRAQIESLRLTRVRLQREVMATAKRRRLMAENQQKVVELTDETNRRLVEVQTALQNQTQAVNAETEAQARGRPSVPVANLQPVGYALQQQEESLRRALAELRKIDSRRSY